jgi:hypothetical protein
VEDQLFDVVFLLLTTYWYTLIKEYLSKGYFEDVPQEEWKCFTIKSKPYTLYGEKLHKLGPDGILR